MKLIKDGFIQMISESYQCLLITQYPFVTYHLTIFKIGSIPFPNLYNVMHATFLNKYVPPEFPEFLIHKLIRW